MTTPLTVDARATLELMIDRAQPDFGPGPSEALRATLRSTLDHLEAGEPCPCEHCPSIALYDPRDGVDPPGAHTPPQYVLQATAPGVLLLLFIHDDRPTYLELAALDFDHDFTQFPPVSDISTPDSYPEPV